MSQVSSCLRNSASDFSRVSRRASNKRRASLPLIVRATGIPKVHGILDSHFMLHSVQPAARLHPLKGIHLIVGLLWPPGAAGGRQYCSRWRRTGSRGPTSSLPATGLTTASCIHVSIETMVTNLRRVSRLRSKNVHTCGWVFQGRTPKLFQNRQALRSVLRFV